MYIFLWLVYMPNTDSPLGFTCISQIVTKVSTSCNVSNKHFGSQLQVATIMEYIV